MESRQEVKTYRVRMLCDECNGEMKATGETLMTYPPKYIHKCELCGLVVTYAVSYPYIIYEEVDAPMLRPSHRMGDSGYDF